MSIWGHFPQKVWKFLFSADNVREVEEERKYPSKEQSSSSPTYRSSGDWSPLPATDDASPCSPAADSPPHDVLHYVLDYSEPTDNGLPSENININSRLCTLL